MQVLCKQIDCNSDSLQERHVQMQFRLLAVKVGLATWSPQRIVFTKQTRRQKCIYCIHVANKEFAIQTFCTKNNLWMQFRLLAGKIDLATWSLPEIAFTIQIMCQQMHFHAKILQFCNVNVVSAKKAAITSQIKCKKNAFNANVWQTESLQFRVFAKKEACKCNSDCWLVKMGWQSGFLQNSRNDKSDKVQKKSI